MQYIIIIMYYRWTNYFEMGRRGHNNYYRRFWSRNINCTYLDLASEFKLSSAYLHMSIILQNLIFTLCNSGKKVFYTHVNHLYHSMAETLEHRNIRCRSHNDESETIIDVVNDEAVTFTVVVSLKRMYLV